MALLSGCFGTTRMEPAQSFIREMPLQSVVRELSAKDDGAPTWLHRGCALMSWPVVGGLTSAFGKRDGKKHDGVDLMVTEDTPVLAACDGRVLYAGDGLRGYGNLVIVRHSDGLTTVYAHNHRLLVRVGDAVTRRQPLALAGKSGNASATHVHFEVRKDSLARDPFEYLEQR
jgi:murein DD-endopeptidase MepM/ murein hydrolase activator NlpD